MIQNVDEILSAADIQVVIHGYIPLKQKGANYVTNCPFHDEKSGSFTVSPAKQMYKCFGCGKGGNSVSFVMEYEHLSFRDAVKKIAAKYGIAIKEGEDFNHKSPEQLAEIDKAIVLMGKVKRLYHEHLTQNTDAMAYMIGRGFTKETLALWEVGYAPDNWRTVTDFILTLPDRPLDLATKLGIVVEDKEKNRDYFYDRIMFPIVDDNGNCISFGGRIWKAEQEASKKNAKYLNGKESMLYSKSNVLFGLDKARIAIARAKEAILTEGYMDVIMAHQNGLNITVGSCGTSVTEAHAKRLVKIADTIIIAQDDDEAGRKSAIKAIDLFYEVGAAQVDIIQFPEAGMDLDSYLNSEVEKEILQASK